MGSIIEILSNIGKGATNEIRTIVDNILNDIKGYAKIIDKPSNAFEIANETLKSHKEYKPKTIAEHLGKFGVDVLSYLLPSNKMRIPTTFIEQSLTNNDVVDVIKNTAYAYAPSSKGDIITNAIKNMAIAGGIETLYNKAKDKEFSIDNLLNIIASGIGGAVQSKPLSKFGKDLTIDFDKIDFNQVGKSEYYAGIPTNILDWFVPDYKGELSRQVAQQLLKSGELKFSPLSILKGFSDKTGIPFEDILKLHKLNEGEFTKTVDDIINNLDNQEFWNKIKEIPIPDEEYARAIDTLVRKHKVGEKSFQTLSDKEQTFVKLMLGKVKPKAEQLVPFVKDERLKKFLLNNEGKYIDDIKDVIPDELKPQIDVIVEKYQQKQLRRIVPIYKKVYDTIVNYYRTALLSNPSTHIKNIISNTAMSIAKILDDFNYELLNKNPKGALESIPKNIKGYNKFLTKWFSDKATMLSLLQKVADDTKYAEDTINVKRNPIFSLLSKEDGFFKLAIAFSEAEKRGEPLENVLIDPEVQRKMAEYTFTKDTGLADIMRKISHLPLMSFVIPFPRTPSNILVETVKRIIPTNDKESLAKFLTTLELGGLLYTAYKLKEPDLEQYELNKKIAEPISTVAHIYEKAIRNYFDPNVKNKEKVIEDFLKDIKELTKYSTVAQLNSALNSLLTLDIQKTIGRVVGGFVPSIVRRQAIASYPYAVKRKTIKDYLYANLPNYRRKLERYTFANEPIRLNINDPISALLNPFVEPRYSWKQKYYLRRKRK